MNIQRRIAGVIFIVLSIYLFGVTAIAAGKSDSVSP